jgi:subtilisin family serine protease
MTIEPRRTNFMLSPRETAGLQPLSADFVVQQLKDAPDIDVLCTIAPPRMLGLQSDGGGGLGSLILASMTVDKARQLQNQAGARLMVERDAPLTFGLDTGPSETRLSNPGVVVPLGDGFQTSIEVLGANGPLAGAEVYLFGSVWPAQAITDETGRATLSVTGENPDTIRALYVKPKADHWSFWLSRPNLRPAALNRVAVKPLAAQLREFPDRQLLGWGQSAMGLGQLPADYNGAGIKIAVIDSGAAQQTHRNLQSMGPGLSVVGGDPSAWTSDTIGHGSHCAGIIAGGPVAPDGRGVRGFAPAAEVHVIRIFPGGQFSSLVQALDYCMENGIDVANLSLGGGEPSRIVEERIVRAKQMGIACIVAAGNSGGPVQFPASLPHVLAVSAIGKSGEFPSDSYHGTQVLDGFEGGTGYFPAKFSCFGPEIDVCGPGVAIVSSLPPDGFAAWDGTSMAAPHVTGLAALVLAHHPDFKTAFEGRDARRVERLFQIIKQTCLPISFGDPGRSGAGMPQVLRALGLDAQVGAAQSMLGGSDIGTDQMALINRVLLALQQQGQQPGALRQRPAAPARPHENGNEWRNAPTSRGPAHVQPGRGGFAPQSVGPGSMPPGSMPPGLGQVDPDGDINLLRRALHTAGLM